MVTTSTQLPPGREASSGREASPRGAIAGPAGGLPHVGIIGGGQLGKMMAQEAKKLGFRVSVLDPTPGAPAAQLADRHVVGGFDDAERLRELATGCDVVTYDIEHIDTRVLATLRDEGVVVHPSPELLATVQDKLEQKRALALAGIPVARFLAADGSRPDSLAALGFPVVQKLRRGGYDGRGVRILDGPDALPRALPGPSLVEERVDIERELAVIVVRGTDGDLRLYPPVEMAFDAQANILDLLLSPAPVSAEVADAARALAGRVAQALDVVGVMGVELFLDRSGRLLVNEVAPRPHNSGHYTIEACVTCQFEQHLRAVAGLPLGSAEQLAPAVMVNLLGEGGDGPAHVEGLAAALAVPGASIHIYGKARSQPNRKMGHVTVIDRDLERARRHALEVRRHLRVVAGEIAR